jgi:hypothetical protein
LSVSEYGNDNLTTGFTWYNLAQFFVAPGGSFLCTFLVGSRNTVPAAVSGDDATTGQLMALMRTQEKVSTENSTSVFVLKLQDVTAMSLTLTFRLLESTGDLVILVTNEIGWPFSTVESGPFLGNPTYNQHVEVFLQVQENGVGLFVNKRLVDLYEQLMWSNYFPTFNQLVWYSTRYGAEVTKMRVIGGNGLGVTPFFGYKTFTSMNPTTNVLLRPIDTAVFLPEENAVIQPFAAGNSYGYIPFQMVQVTGSSSALFFRARHNSFSTDLSAHAQGQR